MFYPSWYEADWSLGSFKEHIKIQNLLNLEKTNANW